MATPAAEAGGPQWDPGAPIVVQKYGGSSLSDVDRIKSVAARVVETVRAGNRVVVVASAMGNTTSELLALARSVSPNPGRRELDLLVSVGERVSMTLLAMAIIDLGVPAVSFTGSQSGIMTDDNHVAATVLEVRPHRVRRALEQGSVAIVAGFQGVSFTGEVTTLGRGGSDMTAVVLTAALGAEHCELCSDVDGVYTADPRAVPDARRIDTLPLDAAVAMTQAGAKVLQAEAVAAARRLGVQLQASATRRPPGTGTRLPPGPAPSAVVGVAVDDQIAHVQLQDLGLLRGIGPATRAWWTDGEFIHVIVDLRNVNADQLDRAGLSRQPAVVAVSAIGRSVVADPGVTARAVEAITPLRPVRWFAQGITWTALVAPASAPAAQKALHQALIACVD